VGRARVSGRPELRRAIRLPHATALVVGAIIGASIFVQPSEITARVPSVPGVLLVWAAAGAVALAGALVCAELASTFTESGGVYVYLREAFGRPVGFLWGWVMLWSMHSGIVAVIAVVFARYAGALVPLSATGARAVAIGVILLLSAIEFAGAGQILAGSDYPHQIGSIPRMLESLRGLGLPPADEARILGGNAARLLGV
jgi:APA family basic amino acid/polyamine antiporter